MSEAFRIYSKECPASNFCASASVAALLSPFLLDCYSTPSVICTHRKAVCNCELWVFDISRIKIDSLPGIYTGKAKERVLVVLLSDLREMLPECVICPE